MLDSNLGSLLKLQKLNDEINRKVTLLGLLPEEIKQLENQISSTKGKLEQFVKDKKETILKQKDLEVEVESIKTKMADDKKKLHSLKTNIEYKALIKELENYEKKITKIEDEQIKLMEHLESSLGKEKELTKEITAEIELLNQGKEEKEKAILHLKEKVGSLKQDKQAIIETIDPAIIETYEKVAYARNGIGIVEISDRICQGCFQMVTHQMYNNIKTSNNIYRCPHCNRYLYYVEKEEEDRS